MILKRGESDEKMMIVGLILGLIVLIILVYASVNLLDIGEDQYSWNKCHISALARGSLPDGTQDYVPLACQTEKICISDRSKDSACLAAFAGEEGVFHINIGNLDSVSDYERVANLIEKENAAAMLICADALGRGKLNLFKGVSERFGLKQSDSVCVICHRVAVDISDPAARDSVFARVNINEYLEENLVPGSKKTYLQAITDRSTQTYTSVSPSLYKEFDKNLESISPDLEIDEVLSDERIPFDDNTLSGSIRENVVVFMQIRSEEYGDVLINLAGVGITAAGGVFRMPVIGLSVGKALFISKFGAGIVLVGAGIATYNVYEGRSAAAGYCGDFVGNEKEARGGCSTIQTMPYDPRVVNELCSFIEGRV